MTTIQQILDLNTQVINLATETIKDLHKQNEELRAKLAQRHIIGKAYDVTAESINQLAWELDETKRKLREYEKASQ